MKILKKGKSFVAYCEDLEKKIHPQLTVGESLGRISIETGKCTGATLCFPALQYHYGQFIKKMDNEIFRLIVRFPISSHNIDTLVTTKKNEPYVDDDEFYYYLTSLKMEDIIEDLKNMRSDGDDIVSISIYLEDNISLTIFAECPEEEN